MRTMERDSKGRFSGTYDPEIDAAIAAENEQAQKLIKVCDMAGLKPEGMGITKFEETGNWRISYQARQCFQGIALGLVYAFNKPDEEIRELLRSLADALGIIGKQD